MITNILPAVFDQPQIILNEKHVGGRVTATEAQRFIEILRTKGYNVVYGSSFNGFFKTGVKARHWNAAQDQLSREMAH